MWPSQQELDSLHRELAEHPDVAPDDRVRAVAAVGLWKLITLLVAVVAFPLGFLVAGAMMMRIDGGVGIAVFCAFLGTGLAMVLTTGSYLTGRRLQARELRRSLRRAVDRRDRLLATAGAGGGVSSVAVSAGRR